MTLILVTGSMSIICRTCTWTLWVGMEPHVWGKRAPLWWTECLCLIPEG